MVFEHIEKLKREYTDKYVVVDPSRPEWRRFQQATGRVKTVNMNGRALVEFGVFGNIGWYDVPVEHLRIVDKPAEVAPAAEHKAPAKPAKTPAKPAAPAAEAKPKPAAEKPKPAASPAGGMSVADILAAARKGGAASADAPAKPDAQPAKAESETAASQPAPAAAKKPASVKTMSVEEVLAAARGEKKAGGPTAAPPASAAETPAAKPAKAQPAPAARDGDHGNGERPKIDPKKMTVEEILAAARGQVLASKAPSPTAPPRPAVDEAPSAEDHSAEEAAEAEDEAASTSSSVQTAVQKKQAAGPLPTSTDEIIAWCREHDGK